MFVASLFTIVRTWKQPRCPSTDEWIMKQWYILIYTMEYYSAIKRNTVESVLVRWMNREPVIQSEVSQKEKNKYLILAHIYGIQKNGTDEPIFRAGIDTQTQRTDLWPQQGQERVGRIESSFEIYMLPYVTNGKLLYNAGSSTWCSVTVQGYGMGWKVGGISRGREHMYTYG